MKEIVIRNGIFYIKKRAKYFLTGEYPYYRDIIELWPEKLKKIKKLGIEIVSFYIPWRHHYIKYNNKFIYDFSGITQANRNVKLFLNLCKKYQLYAFIKPGPFIHAEVNYGGLINEVEPSYKNNISPLCNIKGEKHKWQKWILPSPADEKFREYISNWMAKFKSEILDQFSFPYGPVIGVQIGNEGIYSNGGEPIDDFDFSLPSINKFKKLYGIRDNIQKWDYPERFQDLKKYYKWAEYQSWYMYDFYNIILKKLKTKLPVLINLNSFKLQNNGIDAWFIRNNIEKWKNINYGFTNWLGVVAYDENAFYRYLIMIKRAKGFNIEENWGFSKLYDKNFYNPRIPFFQTLLLMGGGVKGFNVYTVVGTDKWDCNIDSFHSKPYPASPPINSKGIKGNKYKILKKLIRFIKRNYNDIIFSDPIISLNYIIYLPEFYLSCWDKRKKYKYWEKFNFSPPIGGEDKIYKIVELLRKNGFDFNFVNLVENSQKENNKPYLFFCSGFCDSETEEKIINFVKSGAKFIILNKLPEFDINNRKLTKIRRFFKNSSFEEYIEVKYGRGSLIYSNLNPLKDKEKFIKFLNDIKVFNIKYPEKSEVFIHYNKKSKVYFLYLFNKENKEKNIRVNIQHNKIRINQKIKLNAFSAGIFKIKENKIIDKIVS